ncbi:ras GTPase-activating protein-binding protein 2-like [Centruroides sculpturatus]|uniref:ras GTPase-activating protein-binding protein 2-like n=1 Tax=Centruroides sculpturatus TaxID=218467 RepID=UPI000C6E8068|nr:ras GTPase-activating protein-binding protein 2-like [Centruroides sculpturatus]
MVMEQPSPQCVGHEFVRQYYTLLNKAPLHLHRFYSNNSSFVHGGLDQPGQETKAVVGQQVTGELSNNGQPMRRFMQTFVLAPQSPKKYYVRNDIFRYQDEVFNDEEEIDNQDSGAGKDVSYVIVFCRNGSIHSTETRSVVIPPPPPPEIDQQPELEAESPKSDWEEVDEQSPIEEQPEMDTSELTSTQPEPKTYANMVSKNAPTTGFVNNTVIGTTSPATVGTHSPTQNKAEVNKSEQSNASVSPSGNQPQAQRISRSVRPAPVVKIVRESVIVNPSGRAEDSGGEGEKRKPPLTQYPDTQQLFVGNLTHTITEDELKHHFMQYGNVLEMRINTKQTQKMGSSGKVPNFGFIVFEDPDSVHKVLEKKPIFFNGHRLNVEEKKTKPRDQRIGDGRIGIGRSGMMGRGGLGGRGGGRGGMGGPQGTGRGEIRGGGRGGNYGPRR